MGISAETQYSERASTLERLFAFDGFSYGVGFGFSNIIEYMPEQTRPSILQVLLPKYQNFAFGLGYGIGRAFSSLNQKLPEEMLELVEKSNEFARGLGQGIGFSFKYLESIVQQGLLIFTEKSNEFARGLGQGIGNIFPSLNQKLQEEMLELVEKSNEFARGLAQGLSHSVAYLDEVSQTKLTAKIKNYTDSTLRDLETNDIVAEFVRHDNDFPTIISLNDDRDIVGRRDKGQQHKPDLSKWNLVETEILFSGRRENYCICYIDMMNSTQISSTLDDLRLSKYYSIFLNSMATIDLTIMGSGVIDGLNKFLKENITMSYIPEVYKAVLPSNQIKIIIIGVRKRIGEFLDKTILELEYGRIPEHIFENIRKEVDHKLVSSCPNAIEKLKVTYERIGSSQNPEDWSHVATSCRRIINDVADVVFPPQPRPTTGTNGKKHRLDENAYINRIITGIRMRASSRSEISFLTSMINYVDKFLHEIQGYASKGDHATFAKTDAVRCVVYTYLLLGDILHYYYDSNEVKR